jgi:hypothetical protein
MIKWALKLMPFFSSRADIYLLAKPMFVQGAGCSYHVGVGVSRVVVSGAVWMWLSGARMEGAAGNRQLHGMHAAASAPNPKAWQLAYIAVCQQQQLMSWPCPISDLGQATNCQARPC